jgi:hypothetical protein
MQRGRKTFESTHLSIELRCNRLIVRIRTARDGHVASLRDRFLPLLLPDLDLGISSTPPKLICTKETLSVTLVVSV